MRRLDCVPVAFAANIELLVVDPDLSGGPGFDLLTLLVLLFLPKIRWGPGHHVSPSSVTDFTVGTLRYLDGCFRGRLTGSNFTRVDCIAHVCTTRAAVLLLSRTSELEFCRPRVNVSTFVANAF